MKYHDVGGGGGGGGLGLDLPFGEDFCLLTVMYQSLSGGDDARSTLLSTIPKRKHIVFTVHFLVGVQEKCSDFGQGINWDKWVMCTQSVSLGRMPGLPGHLDV